MSAMEFNNEDNNTSPIKAPPKVSFYTFKFLTTHLNT